MIAVQVLVAHLLWRLMLRVGVDALVATAASAIFVVIGAGWENLVNAFQITFMAPIALGLIAILVMPERGRFQRRDAYGWICSLVAIMCSGLGITVVLVLGGVALLRRGWQRRTRGCVRARDRLSALVREVGPQRPRGRTATTLHVVAEGTRVRLARARDRGRRSDRPQDDRAGTAGATRNLAGQKDRPTRTRALADPALVGNRCTALSVPDRYPPIGPRCRDRRGTAVRLCGHRVPAPCCSRSRRAGCSRATSLRLAIVLSVGAVLLLVSVSTLTRTRERPRSVQTGEQTQDRRRGRTRRLGGSAGRRRARTRVRSRTQHHRARHAQPRRQVAERRGRHRRPTDRGRVSATRTGSLARRRHQRARASIVGAQGARVSPSSRPEMLRRSPRHPIIRPCSSSSTPPAGSS